jgi:hypothetical protein
MMVMKKKQRKRRRRRRRKETLQHTRHAMLFCTLHIVSTAKGLIRQYAGL